VERIGFVGLGIMGSRMAANLRRAGYELTVHNRTRERAESWAAEHGGTVVDTPAEVGAASDIVITMVVDGDQVQEILLGEHGVAVGASEGTLCVDMSTIAPGESRRIAASLAERGIGFVDAPVTGSSPRAEDGTLTIMASGASADLDRARPLFDVMGKLIINAGADVGQAQMIKLINNAVAAANAHTLAQALVVGRATGVDLDALVQVLAAGSGNSTMVGLKAKPMREHDYSTLFKLEHMLKDIRLCLEEGQAAGVPFPAAASVREALNAGMGRGLGDADFAALLEGVEGAAGVRL
jgi:3-hydroxyisobutyrate dehydrogenase-like beta-hydroxyacid dehydrogenase